MFLLNSLNSVTTRMHSSRVRTARLLPVSPSMHCSRRVGREYLVPGVYLVSGGVYLFPGGIPGSWGVPNPREVPGPGGMCTWSRRYLVLGVYLVSGGVPGPRGQLVPGGCAWSGYLPRYSPLWTEWQTGAKIVPCPKLRLRAVKIFVITVKGLVPATQLPLL